MAARAALPHATTAARACGSRRSPRHAPTPRRGGTRNADPRWRSDAGVRAAARPRHVCAAHAAGWSGAVPQPDTRAAQRGPAAPARGPRLHAGGSGSRISPRYLAQDLEVERLVGDHAFQPLVLVAQLAQLLGVVGLHSAVLVAPPVKCLLADLQRLRHFGDALPLAEHPIRLPELAHDLFRRVLPVLHGFLLALAGDSELSYQVDRSQGVMPPS